MYVHCDRIINGLDIYISTSVFHFPIHQTFISKSKQPPRYTSIIPISYLIIQFPSIASPCHRFHTRGISRSTGMRTNRPFVRWLSGIEINNQIKSVPRFNPRVKKRGRHTRIACYAAGHRVSPNNEIVPSVFAARPRCRLVYANRNDDDREAGYKHLLFTMRQRLTRSCVIPAASLGRLSFSPISPTVSFSVSWPVSTPCQVHTRCAIRSACECVRMRVTLIIKRRIITACTRSGHRVYGTYLLHNNVPPLVVYDACVAAAWAARARP